MSIKIKLGDRHHIIPAGEYSAKVVDIREGTFVGKRKSLEFIFEICEGPHSGTSVRGYANAHYDSFSEYTKLRQWLNVATKLDHDPGTEVDLNIFFSKVFRVEVKNTKSRKTGNEFSNVKNILGLVCEL